MNKILRFTLAVVMMLTAVVASAADAKTVLDKTYAAFQKAGDVKIQFTATVQDAPTRGTLKLSGTKLYYQTDGTTVWFDGKTMWTYVKENEEVNVTTPTQSEVARMNPYTFLSLYKKGYKIAFGSNTKKYYEVVLTANGKTKGGYSVIVVHIDKQSYQPLYVSMKSSKGDTSITVNSFAGNQAYQASTFTFNKKNYPDVEVVDLR